MKKKSKSLAFAFFGAALLLSSRTTIAGPNFKELTQLYYEIFGIGK